MTHSSGRRRRIIALLGFFALAAGAGVAYGFRAEIESAWWIGVLRSEEEPRERRLLAAERLGELGVASAVEPLLEAELSWTRVPSEEFDDPRSASGTTGTYIPAPDFLAPSSPWISALLAVGDEAVRPLLRLHGEGPPARRELIERVLRRIEVSSRVARLFIETVGTTESLELRRILAYRLIELSELRPGDARRVTALAESDDPSVRVLSLRLARSWLAGSEEPAGELRELAALLLDDASADVRTEAAMTIGQVGAASARVAERLEAMARDAAGEERFAAEQALARIASEAESERTSDDDT